MKRLLIETLLKFLYVVQTLLYMSNYFSVTGSYFSGECGVDEFQCHDKTCISLAKRCDHHSYDCPDGSDEENCGGEIHYNHLTFYVHWSMHRVICVNNYPTSCNNIEFIYICKLLYMFQVVSPPIIKSSCHCIYSICHELTLTTGSSNGLNNARYCRYSDNELLMMGGDTTWNMCSSLQI